MATFDDIVQSIPQRFRTEKAANYSGVFHFDITEDGYPFSVYINNGTCQLAQGLDGTPQCIIKTKAKTYIALETGQLNPQMALLTGKVKVSNLAAMMEFAKFFRKYVANTVQTSAIPPSSPDRKPQSGPLLGIKVIDFTRLLPGPVATMMMADMGAEVIKVEDPDAPDYIRDFAPFKNEQAAYYTALNRSKKSLAINYRSDEGRKALLQVIAAADVLVEQFRPGVMAQMGLGFEQLQTINPRLVYVSLTGYGQSGPYAQRAGHDLNYLAISGLLGVTGTAQQPVIPGGQIADVGAGGYMTVNACLAALLSRHQTGLGQHVDVAMMDATMPLISLAYAEYDALGVASARANHQLSGRLANYNIYATADNKHMALGALEPKFWNLFCEAVQQPAWKARILDEGAAQQQLKQAVEALFKSQPQSYWVALGEKYDCCLTPVLAIDELPANEQIKHRGLLNEGGISTPMKFSGTPPVQQWPAPALGADTLSVLRAHGVTAAELQKLLANGLVKA